MLNAMSRIGVIVIPGEPEPKRWAACGFGARLYANQLSSILGTNVALDKIMKLNELRKSCGVESTEKLSWSTSFEA